MKNATTKTAPKASTTKAVAKKEKVVTAAAVAKTKKLIAESADAATQKAAAAAIVEIASKVAAAKTSKKGVVTATPLAPKVKAAKAPKAEGGNKRITEGTPTKEWRVRKSQRTSTPGYFVQGGEYRKVGTENQFFVGVEHHFVNLDLAKAKFAELAK